MDDSTKSKDREWTVKKWKNDGGILIISYELYSILVGMRGSTTTEKGESVIDMLTGQSYTPVARKKPKKQKVDDFHERMRDWLFAPDLVVIDEGTKIKNADTNFSKALNSIQTRNRMILTGTPLQNHLMEYYSMVNWVRPDYWTKDEFKRLFVTPIRDGMKADDDPFAVNVMKQRSYVLVEELKNFVDRKDQSILVRDLPQKKEYVVYFKLTKFQKRIYKLFLNAVVSQETQITNHVDHCQVQIEYSISICYITQSSEPP
jgi:transcriptional regulator ATRX